MLVSAAPVAAADGEPVRGWGILQPLGGTSWSSVTAYGLGKDKGPALFRWTPGRAALLVQVSVTPFIDRFELRGGTLWWSNAKKSAAPIAVTVDGPSRIRVRNAWKGYDRLVEKSPSRFSMWLEKSGTVGAKPVMPTEVAALDRGSERQMLLVESYDKSLAKTFGTVAGAISPVANPGTAAAVPAAASPGRPPD
jgi:hypothetical protein